MSTNYLNPRMSRLLTKLEKGIRKCKPIWKYPVAVCKCTFFFACSPCLVYLFVVGWGGDCRRQDKRNKRKNPFFGSDEMPQFPSPRPRALGLPLNHARPGQTTSNQSQSAFMMKFPLEIRRMIYSHVLGGQVLHLWAWYGVPRGGICWHQDGCGGNCAKWKAGGNFPRFNLALLRTCRSIYTEAVDCLYFANTFSVRNVDRESPTLKLLSYYFLPQRLLQVRDLRVQCSFFMHPIGIVSDPELWLEGWEAIGKMKGLQRLHVTLEDPLRRPDSSTDEEWRDKVTELMRVVETITAPSDFAFYVPNIQWLEWSADVDLGDSKCVFKMAEEPIRVGWL